MRTNHDPRLLLGVCFMFGAGLIAGCNCGDTGVNDSKFACKTDADCAAGNTCNQGVCTGSATGGGTGGTGGTGGSTGGGTGGGATGGGTGGGSTGGGAGGGATGGGSGGGSSCTGVGASCYNAATGCPGDGGACLGLCRRGTVICDGGVPYCAGARGPRTEDCANQADDDCDGLTDCEQASCANVICGNSREVCCGTTCTSVTTASNCGGCGTTCPGGACVNVGSGSFSSPRAAVCVCGDGSDGGVDAGCPGTQACSGVGICGCSNGNQCPAGATCSNQANYCYFNGN